MTLEEYQQKSVKFLFSLKNAFSDMNTNWSFIVVVFPPFKFRWTNRWYKEGKKEKWKIGIHQNPIKLCAFKSIVITEASHYFKKYIQKVLVRPGWTINFVQGLFHKKIGTFGPHFLIAYNESCISTTYITSKCWKSYSAGNNKTQFGNPHSTNIQLLATQTWTACWEPLF